MHTRKLLEYYPGIEIINGYGPTENTTFTLTCPVKSDMTSIPIGKPVNNTTVFILDGYNNLVPIGVPGEICTGGDGLARGYLNRQELTKEKFTPNPFATGQIIYRTGDIGRWLPDGNVAFIGRKDDQVKIRGYRIETGEVEAALQGCAGVGACIVVAKNVAHEKVLVAYVTGDIPDDTSFAKEYLGRLLPAFMVPAHIVKLQAMPLTPNGKVDKLALPEPVPGASSAMGYTAPRTATESTLALIWEELLSIEKAGVYDNFFELGGHSLKVTRLAAAIHQQFNVKVSLKELFASPTLEMQAALLQQKKTLQYKDIPKVPVQPNYPLSESQTLMWLACQLGTANAAYNMPVVCMLYGNPEQEAMCSAFAALAERHEILRTVFRPDEHGEIKQYILDPESLPLIPTFYDMQQDSTGIHAAFVTSICKLPFDLSTGPLLRATLIKTNSDTWIFVCVMHHIISDGWSLNILLHDLLTQYNAKMKGFSPALPDLDIQYKDYAAWHSSQLMGEQINHHRQYWMNNLEGDLPVLNLKIAGDRPLVKTFEGRTIERVIDAHTSWGFKKLCADVECTLFMGLLAVVSTVLYKYGAQEDMICGTSIAGREHAALEHQIGYYLNTLPLRMKFKARDSFLSLMATAKRVCLDAYEHQLYPFARMVSDVGAPRNPARNSLFDVYLLLQNNDRFDAAVQKADGLRISKYHDLPLLFSKFDLSFNFSEEDGRLKLLLEYDSILFRQRDIEALAGYFEHVMTQLINRPLISLRVLNETPVSDKLIFIKDFEYQHNRTTRCTIVERLLEILPGATGEVMLNPGGTMVALDELNKRANRLCRFLVHTGKAGSGIITGIKISDPGWRLLMTLGVLKAGGAYVRMEETWIEQYMNDIAVHSGCNYIADIGTIAAFANVANQYQAEEPGWGYEEGTTATMLYAVSAGGVLECVKINNNSALFFISWGLYDDNTSAGSLTAAALLDAAGESIEGLYWKVQKHISMTEALQKTTAFLFTAPLSNDF
jgi:non-ribosomal peptide synthetase component F/aryl carrier-like protein